MSHKYGDDIRIITPITSSNMSHLTDDQIRELKIETLDTMTGAEIKALLLTMSKKSGNYQQVVSILEKLHSDDEVKSVAIDCIRGCTITPELRQEMIIYTKRRYFKAKSLKKNQTEVNQPIHQPNTTSSSTNNENIDGSGVIPHYLDEKYTNKRRQYYNTNQCAACEKKSNSLLKCSQCGTLSYCDKQCQKLDWKIHKIECFIVKKTNQDPNLQDYVDLMKNVNK